MVVYFNSKYLHLDDVKISPFDRAYLFSDGVYEALRSYNRSLFRLDDHLSRLRYSITQLHIPFSDFSIFYSMFNELVKRNNITDDFSVYIQISRGNNFPRTHHYESNINPNIFAYVKPISENKPQIENGVAVILEKDLRWSRCDIKSISLLGSVIANQTAFASGAYEAILHRDNLVTEGSHTNFFGIKDNTLYTAPLSNFILSGVTRKLVLELCRDNQISYREQYIDIRDLVNYDEFFITGTTTEITPVIKIDDRIINDGKPGKMTRKIQELFFNITNETK